MATLSSFKQQNAYKIGISSMLTEEQQKSAITKAAAEEEEKKNQGGFLGGIGYSLEKISLGFLSGIEGIWDYAAGGLAKLFGADDWAEHQIANDWVNYNHADEWFNPSEGWQFVGDVAGGIGTSVPAIAGVAAGAAIAYFSGGTLTPVAASLIAGSIAGLGAAGRATKEAYDQTGELTGKEFGYGVFVGVTEGAIEGVSSAIGAGTGAVVKSISKSFGKEVAKSATRNTLLKGVVKGFAGEAFEEGVQAILEPVYKRMTYDPNAKNATFQEVAYAALVGGLSGAIMGGGDVAVRNIRGTTRGNTLVNEGKAGDVITTAEQISSYQTENQTDYETFQVVQNTLDELKTSLQKTGGEVRTVRQKMLLGVLEQANISAAFEPIVTASAENIYNNAETVAARLNELGYQDQDGKPIQITAEQIREGIDTTDAKSFRKTMSRALKTNSALRTLAVADTVGQISMDTARFRDAALSEQSSKLITQADLNRFVEQATDAERQAVADRLGIENWETLTNEQFHDKIIEFVANGGVQEYQQERGYVKEAQAVAPEAARKHLPRMVNLRNDGTYRYTQGGTDIAITKRGDSYYVYDYESGLMSKALSRTETNRVLREIHTNEQNYQNGVRQHTEAQNRLREQAAEIDTYARENISEYKNLSAAGQAAIRATIRQGRAAGVQEDFVLSCARVSARSGLRVVFSKEASFVAANGSYADGAIDLKNNRIIINPEAKSRSGESILIHELTHAIYNDTDGTLTVAEGLETMTDAEKEKIRKRYAAVGQGTALQVSDEINAHFAEQTLSNKNILERLVQKKQTLKDKILGFFKKARTDYQSDERLTGAAARLYRQYKKLFDEFSSRNQRYLGVENLSAEAEAQAGNSRFALSEAFERLGKYTDSEIASIEATKHFRVARSYSDVRQFIADAQNENTQKRLFLGKVTPETATKIFQETGINAEGKGIALSGDDVRHIFARHGVNGSALHQGDIAVTQENFENIIETLIDPDSVSRTDQNGTRGILFQKEIGGRVTAITLVSEKKKALTLKSAWITKSGGRTPSASADTLAGTPETNGRSSTKRKQATSPSSNAEALNSTSETLPRIKPASTDSISQNRENVNPESQKGKKFALPDTDSDGNALSNEQRAFFSRSKITDAEGRLRVMYHGSNAEFSVFDESRISSTTKRYMAGFYFTAEKRVAEKWSRYRARTQGGSPAVFEVYLNIKNPLYLTEQEYKRLGYDEKYRETVVNQLFENQNDGILISPEQERISGLFEDSYNYELDDSVYYQSERYGITDKEYAWWLLRAVQNPDFTSTQAAVLHADQVKLVSNKQPTSNADMRFALSDSVVNVDSANETAAWTSERVTDLVERYGATNPRYTQAYATWINPADFVKATTVNQARRNQIYDEAGNLDIDRLSHETQTPFLDVDYDTMRIVSHEGRHRMAALAKAGVKRVAVAIRFTESSLSRYDARIMEGEHKFKGQRFSNWDTATQRVITRTSRNFAPVGTLVPINAAYSAQLSEFTSERGVRFALDSSEDSNAQTRGNYSVGQRARFAANNTGMRVYTKAEAAEVINSIIEERLVFEDIGMYGELRGKDRRAVIDYLFRKLNTVKEGYRGGVALRIADYMIEHTVLTDMYTESSGEVSEAMRKLSILRGYMHKIDLRHIQDEMQYKFDKKNSINLVWGAKEGGIAPDTLPQLLADEGIFIDAVNEADCFLQMVEMYEDARAAVNNATESVMLSTYGDARTIKDLRQQIARDVLNAYEQQGRKSKYAKLVEKYTKQIAELKQRLREANANNRLINSIVDQAQKMRDLKLGTFQNATQYDTEIFRSSIEKLGKIKFRGNFNIAGTRKIMADLRTWYTKENPLLADTYEQGIADMLDEVANGKTNNYTKSELQSIRNIMAYFTNYVEHFNKVYRQGRWVDAVPEATRYIDILHRNEELKSSWFMRKVGTAYLQTFGDPLAVMRRMDRYESGFYTETFSGFREAKIDAEIAKMQLMEEYEAFLKKNKKYLAQAAKETVQYRDVEVPRMHLISLYMTLKRQHAQAGLAENGFGFWNAQDMKVRVDGFAKGITDESELRAAAIEEQARIAELLSETDKEYIAILEKGYQEAGRLKAERDIQRLGFTNATEDYYYPIRRGNIAKNVDSAEMQQELDRISNASFNKDTVRGAKQELFIESADAVFNRHVRGVVQYAYISPAIETYNKLYNLDIAGTPNKPVSVSTESANVWKQGNDYFKKLITDIQGIFPVSSEGRAVLSFIRGSYAKFQLGANPKVWVTQLSSLFASSSLLDASSITRGMTVSAKDVDTYCPLAKLRAQDNTAAMAQGVLDKVDRISNVLMAPIGKMDRFVVRRLFGACQVQVQKDGGAKIGTEANKIEAGKLLKRVILETQQNSLATERSAAMRSGNEIMRTLTMFSADSMKVIGRVIDSVGELSALKARLRTTTDAESRSTLQTQIKTARRNVRKSLTALATSALFMVAIAQLFNWLYNKDKDDDETAAQQVLVDFAGNLLGGLPLVRDIYSRIAEGYSVDNYAYSALNDLLDSAVNLFDTVGSLVSGDESNSKLTARTKNLLYALGQLTGIPTRNLYNVFYGLTKRISPTTAYKIDEAFYAKNYVTDLNKAIESDDTDMISMLTSMIFGERMGNTTMGDAVRNKFVDLYSKGYSVLPRSIGDTITYGGVEIPLTDEEYSRFRAIYAQSMKDIEKMVNSGTFSVLSEEMQAKAIKQVYDAYYYDALSDLVGVDERTTVGELSEWIDMSRLSVAFAGLSDIESDKNSKGETIAGSKKKNTVRYLLGQTLSDGERLLILCYRGYSIQDGDYKGYTAKRAKRILLQYILKLNGTQAEKAALAEKCGFTVRNGRIIRDF